MRTQLTVLVAAATALGGCELIVRFDSSRLDAGADVRPDAPRSDVPDDAVDDAADDAPDGGDDDAGDGATDDVADDGGMDATAGDGAADDASVMPDVQADAADAGASLVRMNGCDPATAVDLTAPAAMRVVTFPVGGNRYAPACIRILPGQSVRFDPAPGSSFVVHPLEPGVVDTAAMTTAPQPGNPIASTRAGAMPTTFVFPQPGSWGYYCGSHWPEGMFGAVYVGTP